MLIVDMAFQNNKALPRAPPCFEEVQRENVELKERNMFLQDVIEVLYVQNQQLSTCVDIRKKHQRELKAKIERLHRSISDLNSTQAQKQDLIRQLDKERQEHWKEFCQHKTHVNGNHLWEYLEKIKSDIIDKQYEDLIRKNEDSEIVIGITGQDL
jgi:predicted nuclease with TOPRIM domain